jgi:hypothetical protein
MSEHTKLFEEARNTIRSRSEHAGVSESTAKDFIIGQLAIAIEKDDWYVQATLLEMARSINSPDIKADILNNLLLIPDHSFHQEVAREIQLLGHPSSTAYIEKILSDGFGIFEYTCSEDGVIAKWFSHALADIGTKEAIQTIQKFALSSNEEIAHEMKYRLEKIHA